MNIFNKYAEFYDTYYVSKNYKGETQYVLALMRQYGIRSPKTLLDIGCGTGGHLIHFAKAGIKATGFDLSEVMINTAREKIRKTWGKKSLSVTVPRVEIGDARSYRDGKKYDGAVSMFAAMGYLTSNEDFIAGLKTARVHLKKSGLFIFDVWFGPTVLSEKPETRIQEFKKDGKRSIRMVTSELDPLSQTVRVHYNILQIDKNRIIKEADEIHEMRFFFIQELKLLLENTGFALVKVCPFMADSREPVVGDWNISVVARAV